MRTARRLAVLTLTCPAALATACASSTTGHAPTTRSPGRTAGITDYYPGPCPSGHSFTSEPASAPRWSPPGASTAVQARVVDNGVITLHVGQRVRLRELVGLTTTPHPVGADALRTLTWYGDQRTFLARAPGSVAMAIDSGVAAVCTPPGGSIHMTVKIEPSSTAAPPEIPPPAVVRHLDHQTVTLRVGQQISFDQEILSGVSMSGDTTRLVAVPGTWSWVASRPGRVTLADADATQRKPALTLVITP